MPATYSTPSTFSLDRDIPIDVQKFPLIIEPVSTSLPQLAELVFTYQTTNAVYHCTSAIMRTLLHFDRATMTFSQRKLDELIMFILLVDAALGHPQMGDLIDLNQH